jgi:hypothetical protein
MKSFSNAEGREEEGKPDKPLTLEEYSQLKYIEAKHARPGVC